VKKIFKLTVLSFIGPFIATFFVVLFVILIQFLWTYVDDMVGKGLEWYVILKLLFFASASFVPTALPLAILLSSIMAFGNLAESYELVALKSAGISLARIMVPLITMISLIAIGDFFFSNNLIPVANLKFQSLLWDVRKQRPALDIKEGVFYNGIDNYSIHIEKKDKKSQKIEGVTIYDHTSRQGNDVVLIAKSGEMTISPDQRWLGIKLYDGTRYEEMRDKENGHRNTDPANRLTFKSYEIKFDLSEFKLNRTDENLFKENSVMLNLNQLQYYVDSLHIMKQKKLDVDVNFEKQYLLATRDASAIKQNPDHGKKTDSAMNKAFVYSLPTNDPKHFILRAENTARALKDMYSNYAEELSNTDKEIRKYEVEWHRKFSLSFACLTLFFIGAPLGAIIRKGGIGYPTVVAIFMFLIYYVISIIGERSAREDAIGIFTGMWISTLILFPVGLYLTYRANRDSVSFNYSKYITGIISFFKKRFKSKMSQSAN